MIEINIKRWFFNRKEIWFSDIPFEVSGVDQVIFYDCKKAIKDDGFSIHESKTLIIDLTQNLEDIWGNMSKSSCRYMINRAEKEYVKIKISNDFNQFQKINDRFRKYKGLSSVVVTEDYKKNGILFFAEYRGEIIGGQFYLFDQENFRWLLGASERFNIDKNRSIIIGCANRLMIWEAIKYAKSRGLKEFDFGGYCENGEDEEKNNISNFKKSFGGKMISHFTYAKYYSKLYKIISHNLQ